MKLNDIQEGAEYALRWSPNRNSAERVRVERIIRERSWSPRRGDHTSYQVRIQVHNALTGGYGGNTEYTVRPNQIWRTWADYEAERARARERAAVELEAIAEKNKVREDARESLVIAFEAADVDAVIQTPDRYTRSSLLTIRISAANSVKLADLVSYAAIALEDEDVDEMTIIDADQHKLR